MVTGKEEIRVRKLIKDDLSQFTMTIKKGEGLVREEIEFDIIEETYKQLIDKSNQQPLIKNRSKIKLDGYQFDYDEYINSTKQNLKTIEVEFETEEEAHNFKKPFWFGEEVTEDKTYKNQNLWLNLNV